MKSPNTSNHKGFTLIEVLIVIGIMAIIAGFGMWVSHDVFRGTAFRNERDIVVSVLSKARSNSMNNLNQTSHGVYINSSSYILFQGSTYDPADPKNIEVKASANISNSGPVSIVFDQITGNVPAANGTEISIALNSDNNSGIIKINQEGRINW
jgi:prepilin-type N-terminal cleavage/methylation domain-containing protein